MIKDEVRRNGICKTGSESILSPPITSAGEDARPMKSGDAVCTEPLVLLRVASRRLGRCRRRVERELGDVE